MGGANEAAIAKKANWTKKKAIQATTMTRAGQIIIILTGAYRPIRGCSIGNLKQTDQNEVNKYEEESEINKVEGGKDRAGLWESLAEVITERKGSHAQIWAHCPDSTQDMQLTTNNIQNGKMEKNLHHLFNTAYKYTPMHEEVFCHNFTNVIQDCVVYFFSS